LDISLRIPSSHSHPQSDLAIPGLWHYRFRTGQKRKTSLLSASYKLPLASCIGQEALTKNTFLGKRKENTFNSLSFYSLTAYFQQIFID
jgi:hypothetical protein